MTDGDLAILDFEGEPARPLAERREKQLAVKDAAGMVRSFDYAAHVAVRQWRAAHGSLADDDLQCEVARGVALAWRDAATRVFLEAYQATAAGAPFQPADPAEFQRLLRLHVLEKAVYELLYELNHRPDWVGIPLAAIAGEE
jgi:maltose alpha-D-glucosyltransferase/alpha-amylase